MQDPRFVVKWAGGNEASVKLTQSDSTRWDMERAVRKWPQQEDAWNLWSTFVVWNALRRTQQVEKGMPFDVFVDQVESIVLEGLDEVDPTPPEVTPDS